MAAAKQKPELEVRMSATLGDGEFNFRKVEISLTMPCEVETIDETYGALKDFVKGNLEEEVDAITKSHIGMKVVEAPGAEVDLDDEL